MTLTERLTDAQAHATTLYLRRQEVESERQRLGHVAQQIDLSLVKSDGAIELLQQLIAAEPKAEPSGE
jgi:hypothetical protein